MSTRYRVVAALVTIIIVALGVVLMVQRIGSVIGWENVPRDWWVFALIALLILAVAFLIYRTLTNRLSR